MDTLNEKLRRITCFIFDLDGVLTDGTLLIMDNEHFREMHIRDGYAIKQAIKAGYKVLVVSKGDTKSIKRRMKKLEVTEYIYDEDEKAKQVDKLMKKYKLKKENVLYMGDDLPDYDAMKKCGIATCPSDAVRQIKNIADYISDAKGGLGAVRDVIEKTMYVQGKWFKKAN